MKRNIVFIGLSITTFFILIVVWFFLCFFLGYVSNSSNHNMEIWFLYALHIPKDE